MCTRPAPITKKYRILVIDNERESAHSLLSNLAQIGAIGHLATDGKSGILAFRQIRPHLLLLNPILPDLDGFQLCADLRRATNIPIILISGSHESMMPIKATQYGADVYIQQDINAPMLRAQLCALLRRAYWYDHRKLPFKPLDKRINEPISPGGEEHDKLFWPDGWIICDACGYMGPSVKFSKSAAVQHFYKCPHCDHQESLIFAI